MKQVESLFLEVKVLDDGLIRARRKDRKPLTDDDRTEARRLADSEPVIITVNDMLKVFPGATVAGVDDLEGGPSFRRGLKGGPCRACGQRLPLDDEGFINLWGHQCLAWRVRR